MNTGFYRNRAKEILKGRYGEGFFIVTLCITVYLIFKLVDIAGGAIILYNSNGNITELFRSSSIFSLSFKVIRYILCFIFLSPLITGGLWWFSQTSAGEDNRSILKLYTGVKLNMRAALLYGFMWTKSMISLLPSGICWLLASETFKRIPQYENQALVLFTSLQLLMAGIFLLGLYLRSILGMVLAPFLFITHPDMGTFNVLKISRRKMKGSKIDFLKLVLTYIPAMLPVVTIPFVLPSAVMSVCIFAGEKIKEEHIGKNNI